jgi:hypothetical protein
VEFFEKTLAEIQWVCMTVYGEKIYIFFYFMLKNLVLFGSPGSGK